MRGLNNTHLLHKKGWRGGEDQERMEDGIGKGLKGPVAHDAKGFSLVLPLLC